MNKVSLFLTDTIQSEDEPLIQELATKLQFFNNEFCEKIMAIHGTLIYYSNRNEPPSLLSPSRNAISEMENWENSAQFLALEIFKKQYRDAIIQTKYQLKTKNARDSETRLEYLSECCRKFFNYIDKALKRVFKERYSMDETWTPFAQFIRNKPNFFNRLEKHDSNLSQNILSLEKLNNSIESIHFDLNEMPASVQKR